MREHVRGKERYFRTNAGDLALDWGSNGVDYTKLDFTYVAKSRGGLIKIYGQVRRNPDGETYDTYDTKAGRNRQKTRGSSTIDNAIKAHIKEETGEQIYEPLVKEGMLPCAPNTIRTEMVKALGEAVKGWDFLMRGKMKEWSEEQKQAFRDRFVEQIWDNGDFFCDSIASKAMVRPVGLLNVDTCVYSNVYKKWRKALEEEEKAS